jgi:histidinol-phosphate aminotransferase
MISIDKLITKVRRNILQLKPYSSARDEFKGFADVFLDANENPFGSPISEGNFNRYPDPMQWKLKQEIAKVKLIPEKNIFIGNGSDEPIDILFRVFCEPGADKILICPPTYGMYEVSANINDVKIQKVNLTKEFQLNVTGILDAIEPNTKMIFICSPNNPSGNLMKEEDVKKVLRSFEGILVLDEAYIDFANDWSFLNVLNDYPNLVILQTFSKAYGMAGLRIGMAFAHEEIISIMNKVKPPYNLNEFSIEQGMVAIKNVEKVKFWAEEIKNSRFKIQEEIKKLSIVEKVYPSEANFLLVKFKNATEIYNALTKKGIVVRDRSLQVNCDNCLRITIGTSEENKTLLFELNKLDHA